MSLLGKVRVVALASAHDLLDKAIDMNSPSVLRQYIRDYEVALTNLHNEAANQAGGVRTLTRQVGDTQHLIDLKKQKAKDLLTTNPAAARALASEVVILGKELETLNLSLDSQKKTSQDIDTAAATMEAKHTEMVSSLRRLTAMDSMTKSKETAASVVSKFGSTGIDAPNVDNIAAKMQGRADVADEKFDRAMAGTATEENPEHEADVDAVLASLK